MAAVKQYIGSYEAYLEYLQNTKQDFVLRKTSKTAKFVLPDGSAKLYCDSGVIGFSELSLMTELKAMIKNSKGFRKVDFGITPQMIRYFDFSDSVYEAEIDAGSVYSYGSDLVEMDITKAYYQVCRNKDLITEEFYQKCLELPKDVRLKLIGSIATITYLHEYKEGKLIDITIKKDDDLRKVWFNICHAVDTVMGDIANAVPVNDFLFYWVDGIYFKKGSVSDNIHIAKSIMKNANFDFTIEYLKKVEIKNKAGVIQLNIEKSNGVKKVFFVPQKQVKGYYIGNPLTLDYAGEKYINKLQKDEPKQERFFTKFSHAVSDAITREENQKRIKDYYAKNR